MEGILKGKTALVTGAARGIGKAIAGSLAVAGANIVIADILDEQARRTAEEIGNGGVQAIAVTGDVSKSADCARIVKQAIETFGTLDILVNNAGITRDKLLVRMSEEDWEQVLAVNLRSVFLCSKAAMRQFMKQRSGVIVNIASVVGVMGNPGQANYSASKAGIIGLTRTLAKEYASVGVTVNAVAPGYIVTEMTEGLSGDVKEDLMKQIPLKRLGMPEEVAGVVRFLVSPDARYITGQVIHVNGGMFMG